MSVTLDVSKLSGWLKFFALWNMKLMSVTLDVLKLSGWFKFFTHENMPRMVVTPEVSQLEMSSLKSSISSSS
eukprot:scaffold5850_cov61-Phaeocystis_antarctica.AAC.9